jgi:hypothetical protein
MQTHEVTVVNALAHAEARGGDGYKRWDSEHGARDWCTRVWACSTLPRHGVRHTGSRGTPWGCEQAAGPSALTTHQRRERGLQAED